MIFVAELLIAFAQMFEGRYGEAIEWATRSLSRSPNNAAGLRVAACAYALSGRTQEAAKAAAQLCELVPSLRVGEARKRSLYRRPQDSENSMKAFAWRECPNEGTAPPRRYSRGQCFRLTAVG